MTNQARKLNQAGTALAVLAQQLSNVFHSAEQTGTAASVNFADLFAAVQTGTTLPAYVDEALEAHGEGNDELKSDPGAPGVTVQQLAQFMDMLEGLRAFAAGDRGGITNQQIVQTAAPIR